MIRNLFSLSVLVVISMSFGAISTVSPGTMFHFRLGFAIGLSLIP